MGGYSCTDAESGVVQEIAHNPEGALSLVAVGDLWLARDAAANPGIAIRWDGRPALH